MSGKSPKKSLRVSSKNNCNNKLEEKIEDTMVVFNMLSEQYNSPDKSKNKKVLLIETVLKTVKIGRKKENLYDFLIHSGILDVKDYLNLKKTGKIGDGKIIGKINLSNIIDIVSGLLPSDMTDNDIDKELKKLNRSKNYTEAHRPNN